MNHGTHSGYTRHRQKGEPACDACLEANRAYHRDYRIRRGLNKNVPAAPARQHIIRLLANGATLRGIAAEAGMNVRHLGEIYRGGNDTIWPETERKILAVRRGWSQFVPAAGSARRINAMRRMGWTLDNLADRLGVSFQAVWHILEQQRVHRDTAARIADLYDELSMTPGPSGLLRKRAATKGLPSPLAWDDDELDDPGAWAHPGETDGAGIDPVVVDRLAAGADWTTLGATRGERLAAADAMLRRGHAVAHIEDHLGLRAGRDFRRGVAS